MQLDPLALASRGVGIDEVSDAVQKANVNLPTGVLWGKHEALTVQANGQLSDAAAYRPVIVTYREGSPVRLEEVARVRPRLVERLQSGTRTAELIDTVFTIQEIISPPRLPAGALPFDDAEPTISA